jgi:hypothetical protein
VSFVTTSRGRWRGRTKSLQGIGRPIATMLSQREPGDSVAGLIDGQNGRRALRAGPTHWYGERPITLANQQLTP